MENEFDARRARDLAFEHRLKEDPRDLAKERALEESKKKEERKRKRKAKKIFNVTLADIEKAAGQGKRWLEIMRSNGEHYVLREVAKLLTEKGFLHDMSNEYPTGGGPGDVCIKNWTRLKITW